MFFLIYKKYQIKKMKITEKSSKQIEKLNNKDFNKLIL